MTDSTQYEEELNLILSMIQHERIEVRKRAIDILALMTSPKPGEDHTSQCDFVVCALSSVPNMTKLIRCFTSSNQLLHGSLLTTLVNVTQKIEAVRIFLETQGISRVMQFFFGHLSTTAKSTVSTSILELVLMLLTNLTSLGGVEAARALLQIDTASDLRGFYLESLLNIALEENVSPTTVRWWLNVLTNITCEEFAKSTILSNREILCVLSRWIQECDQYELHAYYSLCVVRNCVLGSNEQHHEALMSCDSILHAVLNNLSEGRPKGSTEFLSAAVEFIYLLCTTKVGVQGMETHNGKKALRAMLDTPSHVLHHEESSNALRMVQKLMNTLEDVQDVVIQTSEEENKPPVETISSETKKHSSNASQDKDSMEHLD